MSGKAIQFTGNKKSSKLKKNKTAVDMAEEDIDQILAELGGASPAENPPLSVSEVTVEKKEGESECTQSAAARKRKKKKEKEKKAAAVDEKEKDTKSKAPKHIREELEKRRKLEERLKKEEEEKLRKEEEERLRKEAEERLLQEAKLKKKERQREKRLKKKEEGKLLTNKQKEERRRLEAQRNQYLVKTSIVLPTSSEITTTTTKRPKYQSKKVIKPLCAQTQGVVPEKLEVKDEKLEVPERDAEQKQQVPDVIHEDWDVISWDDVNLNFGVKSEFEEEQVEDNAENSVVLPGKAVNPETMKGQDVEIKRESRNADDLRSPICCIMGHVDTGKTKLLDCIRRTNVQESEAGGITQQIGATFIPTENIRERTRELKADAKLQVPGLLVIDTPGHESFANLRSRGSGLCDIAVLVVDIMHGLQPQTIESLNLLKMRNTEFIVALTKVDRLYGWKSIPDAHIQKAMKQQSKDVKNEFKRRLTQIITQFKEQGLNTELYYKNRDLGETFSIVPTSAITGEGIPDLLLWLVQWTQKTMLKKLRFSNKVQCTVLEVKVTEGLGTTVDVVLVNGTLREGDQVILCGMQGALVTTIRALLTPHPMNELRVKGSFVSNKEIKASQGIKITAQGLENAVPGTTLYVVGPGDDLQDVMRAAQQDITSVLSRIDKSGEGVCVQASTLGSLEALLEFLKSPAVNIPVSGISIGPVHKKDVVKASVMLKKKKEYAAILAFDVKVTSEARALAEESGVKIFTADIIYHLFDQFKAYVDKLKEVKKKEFAEEAVFPCVLKILPNCVFNKKDPIIVGVEVLQGLCKVGTPICIPSRDYIDIGRIASIKVSDKEVDVAKKGQKASIKISCTNAEEQQKMYGRHFDIQDELVSHITRTSIDVLKANHRQYLSLEDWKLVAKLKNLFKIQ